MQDFRGRSSQRGSVRGPFLGLAGTTWHCPWLFLTDSWQPLPSSLWPEVSKCMFVHLAAVLFPLCLRQPKHAIKGRRQPKICSVLASIPSPLPSYVGHGRETSFPLFSTFDFLWAFLSEEQSHNWDLDDSSDASLISLCNVISQCILMCLIHSGGYQICFYLLEICQIV